MDAVNKKKLGEQLAADICPCFLLTLTTLVIRGHARITQGPQGKNINGGHHVLHSSRHKILFSPLL